MQTFTRGETIAIAVRNISGVAYTSARADLKKSDLTGDALLEFDVSYHADLGGTLGAGWILKATPAQSLTLPAGMYATDLRVVLDTDDVEITAVEPIQIVAGVTETP